MEQLERRTEGISGEFNTQEDANTLWSNVTMGRKPGERMMGQLERRVEGISEGFNTEDVTNTLWSYVMMGRKPGTLMISQIRSWTGV